MLDIEAFVESRKQINENFKHWSQFIELMSLIQDLLQADREGRWEIHLDAVQRSLPVFAAFDATNYLRWCSLYLEDMRRLDQTVPALHKSFMEGKFSNQQTPGTGLSQGP